MTSVDSPPKVTWLRWLRLALLLTFVGFVAFAYFRWRDELTIDHLALHQQQLRSALAEKPILVLVSAFGIYVLVTGAFIGSATAMSLAFGWLFGLVVGTVLVSFASTTGATLTFLGSRYLFRQEIERRFAPQVKRIDDAFRKDGAMYLFSLRLIPGIPFFLSSAFMGLTPIRLRTYWWVSQVGMLPATILFVYAGSTVPDLMTLKERGLSSILSARFIIALSLLGLFPLVLAWLRRRKRLGSDSNNDASLADN